MSYHLNENSGFTDSDVNQPILKLCKIYCKTNNSNYSVIRYDKEMLTDDLVNTYGLYRSIIINSVGKVVSFSPPKSHKFEQFIQKYPTPECIQAEEFVEGTMINVFFDKSIGVAGSWEITTRNIVGATSSFYKSPGAKTFRQMFMEAAAECKLNIYKLNPELCYSFVLQHPDNRIVVPFVKPQLYLTGVYKINDQEQNQDQNQDQDQDQSIANNPISVQFYDAQEYQHFFSELGTTVKFPQIYEFQDYNELVEKYSSLSTPYDVVGVVIHNKVTGERTKLRNPVYEKVRKLKGNQPKLQYQYLCLRKEGNVKSYLIFYPENKQQFSIFRDKLHLFTNTLYQHYVSCYIRKTKPLIEFPEEYRTHMFNIHQIYINELREKKLFVNSGFVQKYVNDLHPSLLMVIYTL
jgi:hypothetical protein